MSETIFDVSHLKDRDTAAVVSKIGDVVEAAGITSTGVITTGVFGTAAHKLTVSGTTNLMKEVASGTDTDVGIILTPGGTGAVSLAGTTAANTSVLVSTTSSSVNAIAMAGGATGNAPTITVGGSGKDTNVGLSLSAAGTGGVILAGTGTNDSAAAGKVGELISSSVASGSAVALTSPNAKTVTSISLTAGDWFVYGNVLFAPNAATTCTVLIGSINTTTDTTATAPNGGAYGEWKSTSITATNGLPGICGLQMRISLAATTTVYLVAQSTFATNTNAAYGFIGARRVR